jgi:hypothetical protein
MRHGRKSRSTLVDGYQRHVLTDLDSGLVGAVGSTPANAPEATVTDAIATELAAQDTTLVELPIDRAELASTMVRDRGQKLAISCKAWRVGNAGRCTKTDFRIDFDNRQPTCPNQVVLRFEPGRSVHFPKAACASAHCGCAAPPAAPVAAWPSTPMRACWSSSASVGRPRTVARDYVNAPRSSTAWPTSATGKAAAPATSAPQEPVRPPPRRRGPQPPRHRPPATRQSAGRRTTWPTL